VTSAKRLQQHKAAALLFYESFRVISVRPSKQPTPKQD
jgi:hypothetical protein